MPKVIGPQILHQSPSMYFHRVHRNLEQFSNLMASVACNDQFANFQFTPRQSLECESKRCVSKDLSRRYSLDCIMYGFNRRWIDDEFDNVP